MSTEILFSEIFLPSFSCKFLLVISGACRKDTRKCEFNLEFPLIIFYLTGADLALDEEGGGKNFDIGDVVRLLISLLDVPLKKKSGIFFLTHEGHIHPSHLEILTVRLLDIFISDFMFTVLVAICLVVEYRKIKSVLSSFLETQDKQPPNLQC